MTRNKKKFSELQLISISWDAGNYRWEVFRVTFESLLSNFWVALAGAPKVTFESLSCVFEFFGVSASVGALPGHNFRGLQFSVGQEKTNKHKHFRRDGLWDKQEPSLGQMGPLPGTKWDPSLGQTGLSLSNSTVKSLFCPVCPWDWWGFVPGTIVPQKPSEQCLCVFCLLVFFSPKFRAFRIFIPAQGPERKGRNPAQGSRSFGAPRKSTPRFSNSGRSWKRKGPVFFFFRMPQHCHSERRLIRLSSEPAGSGPIPKDQIE